jgi:hypothetical protein
MLIKSQIQLLKFQILDSTLMLYFNYSWIERWSIYQEQSVKLMKLCLMLVAYFLLLLDSLPSLQILIISIDIN